MLKLPHIFCQAYFIACYLQSSFGQVDLFGYLRHFLWHHTSVPSMPFRRPMPSQPSLKCGGE